MKTKMFSAEIWGTVSDWVMVAVTVATAVFLYLTFKEQLRINKALLNQHKRSIRPYFKMEVSHYAQGEPPNHRIIVNNAVAVNVQVFETDYLGKHLPNGPLTVDAVIEVGNFLFLPYQKYKSKFNEHERFFIWDIIYSDEEGRQYSQLVVKDKYQTSTTFPELIWDVV